MVKPCLFIFLGNDDPGKRERIESLQRELFPPDLKYFNYIVIYGDDKRLMPQGFKEELMCFPTDGAQKRLIVIRMAQKLKKPLVCCLKDALRVMQDKVVIVLDTDEFKTGHAFAAEFSEFGAQIVHFKKTAEVNVFDLGRAILDRKPDLSLNILSGLLGDKERTDKILGAIFWQWERAYGGRRLEEGVYKKGLEFILDADKRLKSSSSAFARQTLILEALAVKLSYLP